MDNKIIKDKTMNESEKIDNQQGKRAWLFHCMNRIRTYKLNVYIEDVDRESAIAQFEGIHHDLEWWQTTEVKPVC